MDELKDGQTESMDPSGYHGGSKKGNLLFPFQLCFGSSYEMFPSKSENQNKTYQKAGFLRL